MSVKKRYDERVLSSIHLIEAYIRRAFLTKTKLAELMGIDERTLRLKLRSGNLLLSEVKKLIDILELSEEEKTVFLQFKDDVEVKMNHDEIDKEDFQNFL